METSNIVIHKGEKDEKYQLYVEDYVMSYLKKQGSDQRNRKIFFFGKRELREKKYYIYGAGLQRQIAHFADYEKLHEITCRYVMDMPVFSVQEKNRTYELTGYYIFYHSNEAMQNYLIALRTEQEKEETAQRTEFQNTGYGEIGDRQIERAVHTEQRIFAMKKQRQQEKERNNAGTSTSLRTRPGVKGGLIAIQLTAIFIVLAAIAINTTNSYDKLEDLNQAAVEVFFAMENENAVLPEEAAEEVVPVEGNTLYLAELEEQAAEQQAQGAFPAVKEQEAAQDEAAMPDEEIQKNTETMQSKEPQSTERMQSKEPQSTERIQSEEAGKLEEAIQSEEAEKQEEAIQSEENGKREENRSDVQYYQIQRGDTLYTISQKLYGNTDNVNKICEMNQIENPDNIKYGQKILLP